MIQVTCKTCGWVHFSMSRKEAEDNVDSFNRYFDKLSVENQQDYYGGRKASIASYERCFGCGGVYTNFRTALPGDCPDGCTIQPIIHFGDGSSFSLDDKGDC